MTTPEPQEDRLSKFVFKITGEMINNMAVEDYEALERAEDGDARMYRLRPLMARFLIDKDGLVIPHKIALRMIGQLTMEQMNDLILKFTQTMKENAVPKASRDESQSGLEPASSPDGASSS